MRISSSHEPTRRAPMGIARVGDVRVAAFVAVGTTIVEERQAP